MQLHSQISLRDDVARLEILIISSSEEFQEIEIIYGNKKIRKKIAKRIPLELVDDFFIDKIANDKPQPSMRTGATDLSNLSQDPHHQQSSLLKEKFLRSLAKISQMYETLFDELGNFNYEKFWDGLPRIFIDDKFNSLTEDEKIVLLQQEEVRRKGDLNTSEKAILVAVINHLRPQNQKLDRVIVSSKFCEIVDKKSFIRFVDQIIALIKEDSDNLTSILFPNADLSQISAEKKLGIARFLSNILREKDDLENDHQMKLLIQMMGEVIAKQQQNR